MIEPELIYFDEPKLTFGYGQKVTDPRDGLTLFGPYTRKELVGQVNIGIIGPKQQRSFVLQYLRGLHKYISSSSWDVARPNFPGLEAAFNIYINFDAVVELNIESSEIDNFLKYTDSHQRVYNLSQLYVDKLHKYYNEEHAPVTLWFVAIPDDIYRFGRPKSRIPKSDENIGIGLAKKDRKETEMLLFSDMNELKVAYQFEINFHNQLKAKLLSDKIITQVIRDSTIAYEQLWENVDKIEYEKMFDTAKAWNIATTMYYKAGGIPWKLGDVRENVCYLGLVYKKLDQNEERRNACCAAQMFLDSGDGMVFRGNIGPWYNPETKEFHIGKDDAYELLTQSLEAFKDKSGKYPTEVFIHAKTYFSEDELIGFHDAANGKSKLVGIRIRDDSSFKLYRDFSYCVPRGTALIYTDTLAYLWTNGYIPRIQTQLGLETPNPLSIEIVFGNSDIKQVCKDVLALTKLNYNTCIFADGSPVTLRFANAIGEVLTAGLHLKSEVLPFKHYV